MATAPAEYVILDMNANGDSKAGMREKRKHYIADVLRSKNPLVVFAQEFVWAGIHSRAFEDIYVPDHFQYEGHKEAGFIFDTRNITYSRIDNKTSVRNMYDSMVVGSGMGSDYFELPRLCVYKIKSNGAPHFEILCASWHGPYKVSMENKKKALDTLVKFLLKLKVKEGNMPLLLGGDFNIQAYAVKSILLSNGSLMLNTPHDSSIDMFIMSPDIMQLFSISKVYTMDKNAAFDHLHLKIDLTDVNCTNPQHSTMISSASSSTVVSAPITQHSTMISSASSSTVVSAPITQHSTITSSASSSTVVSAPITQHSTMISSASSSTVVSAPITQHSTITSSASSSTVVSAPITQHSTITSSASSSTVVSAPITQHSTIISSASSSTVVSAPITQHSTTMSATSIHSFSKTTHICSEQTLSPRKKKTSPSVVESKQKHEGQ